jgi:Kef-type K+ transport system membrane component KefB
MYSLVLLAGLVASQFLAGRGQLLVQLLTMFCLSFILIHVGYEFEIRKEGAPKYLWDQVVAVSTTIFPWLLCAAYFAFAIAPAQLWWSRDLWWEALLLGRFAAPTSVGVLFPMLAAAGLSASWLSKKAKTLIIFDDVNTLLLLFPLKFLLVDKNVKMALLVLVPLGLFWVGWRYLYVAQRPVKLPARWPWVIFYALAITAVVEGINLGNKAIHRNVSVHFGVLLPAFILGGLMARAPQTTNPADHTRGSQNQGLENAQERRVSMFVSACFMVLVGLSLPPLASLPLDSAHTGTIMTGRFQGVAPDVLARLQNFPGWAIILIHVLMVTALSNLGKMVPAFWYRKEAGGREALALSIGMFPRGEVGAAVLLVSLSYGINDLMLTVAVLSLTLNLICSGFFVLAVKHLVAPETAGGVIQPATRAQL